MSFLSELFYDLALTKFFRSDRTIVCNEQPFRCSHRQDLFGLRGRLVVVGLDLDMERTRELLGDGARAIGVLCEASLFQAGL